MSECKQAQSHDQQIAELKDSRLPKTEREHAAVREIERLEQRLAAAESELNRLRRAMDDEKVASGVLSAFWRRVYGAANFSAFDKKVLTAHMLTALSGIDVFSKRELVETVCPDCGPVSVDPDIFDKGIPIGGECPYCEDRLYFAAETMSGEGGLR